MAAEAKAGEVLVSGTVKDLVVGSGIRFDDCGQRELKGVPGEWHLFRLAARDRLVSRGSLPDCDDGFRPRAG